MVVKHAWLGIIKISEKILKITVCFEKNQEIRGRITAFNLLYSLHSKSHYSTAQQSLTII